LIELCFQACTDSEGALHSVAITGLIARIG